jgi:hypothetical protein
MIKEPILSSNQYAVLMADGSTGHVLTTEGSLCINGEGEVYVVFDDLDMARKFIEHKRVENDTWEFAIYNFKNECVEHWEARKWKR